MSKKYIFSVATFTLLIGFLLALGVPAQAQVASPTPTVSLLSATPAPTPTPQVSSVSSSNLVSFAQLIGKIFVGDKAAGGKAFSADTKGNTDQFPDAGWFGLVGRGTS